MIMLELLSSNNKNMIDPNNNNVYNDKNVEKELLDNIDSLSLWGRFEFDIGHFGIYSLRLRNTFCMLI